MSRSQEISALEKKLSQAEGIAIARIFERFQYTLRLFERNYAELRQFLRALTAPEVDHSALFYSPNYWKTDILLDEIGFLLHNYVASAKSLVDHSRRVYRKLYSSKGRQETYDSETRSRFEENEIVQFVHGLREMSQHHELPHVLLSHQRPSGKVELQLSKHELLQYKSWNAPAKVYLHAAERHIILVTPIEQYHNIITEFHQWVYQEYLESHKAELEAIREIEKQIIVKEMELFILELPHGLELDSLMLTLANVLPSRDKQRLATYQEDRSVWIMKALEIVRSRLDLPDELAQQIIRQCSRQTA